jgi:sulfonate transport system ATP-binding protein
MKSGCSLEIQNLHKSFGHRKVLIGIQGRVDKGEFVALVGKSGCGKSTLLRLISGLDRPDRGTILLDNVTVGKVNPHVRYLFQEPRLLPWKKVWQNVALGAASKNREKVQKVLKEVGLEDRDDDWPELLSGGQKQRVALARALVGEPELLLLDEPLGALDALTKLNMQKLIEDVWKNRSCTVVLVTHDISEAVYLADRVLLMEDGIFTLDERIEMSRPHARNDRFVHYEQKILVKVMKQDV